MSSSDHSGSSRVGSESTTEYVYGRSTNQAGMIAAELVWVDGRTSEFVIFQSFGNQGLVDRGARTAHLLARGQADELSRLMLSLNR